MKMYVTASKGEKEPKKVKILEANEEHIMFEDGSKITFEHDQDWCEYNYAQFDALDDIALSTEFDLENLAFEPVEDFGFRFGNLPYKMFFVPCYSAQNGFYSSDIQICFNGKEVLNFDCEVL